MKSWSRDAASSGWKWRRVVRPVAVLLATFAVIIAISESASAHAELVTTQPSPGDVLPKQPESIVLTFNEPVDPVERQYRLFDSAQSLTTLEPTTSGNSIVVALPDDLDRGSYVLAWRVVSADGHPIAGALPFAIGEATGTEIAVTYAETDPWVDRLLGLLNGISYACFLIVVGLLWFRNSLDLGTKRRTWPVFALAVGGLIAMTLAIPVSVARQQAETIQYVFSDDWFSDVTSDARTAVAIAAIGTVVLLVGAGRHSQTWRTTLLGIGSLLLLGSLSVVGHTRIVDPSAVIVMSNVTHVVAGAIWLGGLVGLTLAFRRGPTSGGLADLVARFSGVAGVALAGVLISGTISSALILRSFSALIDTSYGQLLLIKIGLVLIVCGLAAWNRFKLVPTVARQKEDKRAFSTLRRIVLAEAALLIVVAMLTGFLVNLSPRVTATGNTNVHVMNPTITVSIPIGDATATGTLAHLDDRRYTLTISVKDPSGVTIVPYETPRITLTLESLDVGPLPVSLRADPDGTTFTGIADFPFAGAWAVSMVVRFSTFESATGLSTITVP